MYSPRPAPPFLIGSEYAGIAGGDHQLLALSRESAASAKPIPGNPPITDRVEAMHGGPSVAPFAHIGGDTFLARKGDETRHEAMIAMTMHRRRKPSDRGAHPASRQRGCCHFRSTRIGRRRRERVDLLPLRRGPAPASATPRRHDKRAFGAFEHGADRLDRTPIVLTAFCKFREVVVEGGVDYAIRPGMLVYNPATPADAERITSLIEARSAGNRRGAALRAMSAE
jgi:hypothetical protein